MEVVLFFMNKKINSSYINNGKVILYEQNLKRKKKKILTQNLISQPWILIPQNIPSFQFNFIVLQMKNPSDLLPFSCGSFKISHISWDDFKGQVDSNMPWSAHIYWHIDFKIVDHEKKKVTAELYMSPRSWVRPQKKCDHLLNHEQGHYLIGSLCVLQFLRRVDAKKNSTHEKFEDFVQKTFDRTIKEFIEMEKQYDNQTEHRLNFKKQDDWDEIIYDKLSYYRQIYDGKKKRFVKYSESPSKNKKK